jgi:putative endonuclease
MSTRKGRTYERQAIKILIDLGFVILDQNYHTPYGELDVVANEGECLCFVEVKGRQGKSDWNIDSIPSSKRAKIIASIEYYLQNKDEQLEYSEIDIVAFYIEGEHYTLLRNAFDGE